MSTATGRQKLTERLADVLVVAVDEADDVFPADAGPEGPSLLRLVLAVHKAADAAGIDMTDVFRAYGHRMTP
ncbi:hypothetical protein ACFFKU_06995 [Kineococcus gynurae]|uniref:Uncharacterized protein n=1 Tax=Kineococcus gynurae TaxID=452979 RepID=A0ABV5LWX6_9ACTN